MKAPHEIATDVAVLTEPAPSYVNGPGVVASPPGPGGGLPWIAIVGRTVEPVARARGGLEFELAT